MTFLSEAGTLDLGDEAAYVKIITHSHQIAFSTITKRSLKISKTNG